MAKNQNLAKTGLYYWDEDLKEWRPANLNFDVNGGLIVSAYESNPVKVTSGLQLKSFDYVSRSVNSATVTWTFRSGGSGGAVTNTVVIVYTDATLEAISTITKT